MVEDDISKACSLWMRDESIPVMVTWYGLKENETRVSGDTDRGADEEDDVEQSYYWVEISGELLSEHLVVHEDGGDKGEEAAGDVPGNVRGSDPAAAGRLPLSDRLGLVSGVSTQAEQGDCPDRQLGRHQEEDPVRVVEGVQVVVVEQGLQGLCSRFHNTIHLYMKGTSLQRLVMNEFLKLQIYPFISF